MKIPLILFGIIIALFLSEITFRLLAENRIEPTKCRKFDPILDHSLVPNSDCRFKTKEWDVDFKVNAQGLRDNNYSLQKPLDTFRILMLGDSFVEGFGVNIEDTYGKILEKSLNENSSKKIEVINAGVSGWSPLSEYLYLREYGMLYQPDLVVLNLNATDFFDDYDYYSRLTDDAKQILQKDTTPQSSIGKEIAKEPESKVFTPKPLYTESVNDPNNMPFVSDKIKFFLNKNIYTYRYLTRSIKLLLGRATVIEVSPIATRGKIDKDLFAITRTEDIGPYKDLFLKPEEDIIKMKNLLQKNNSELIILFIPHGHMVNGREWDKGRLAWGFEKGKTYSSNSLKEIAKWAKANEIYSFDITPTLKEAAKEKKLYFSFDGHWNKQGNRVVAQTLLAVFGQKILNQ